MSPCEDNRGRLDSAAAEQRRRWRRRRRESLLPSLSLSLSLSRLAYLFLPSYFSEATSGEGEGRKAERGHQEEELEWNINKKTD